MEAKVLVERKYPRILQLFLLLDLFISLASAFSSSSVHSNMACRPFVLISFCLSLCVLIFDVIIISSGVTVSIQPDPHPDDVLCGAMPFFSFTVPHDDIAPGNISSWTYSSYLLSDCARPTYLPENKSMGGPWCARRDLGPNTFSLRNTLLYGHSDTCRQWGEDGGTRERREVPDYTPVADMIHVQDFHFLIPFIFYVFAAINTFCYMISIPRAFLGSARGLAVQVFIAVVSLHIRDVVNLQRTPTI